MNSEPENIDFNLLVKELRTANERLSEVDRKRRAWASELERANQELEAFSYTVSHDLLAPLRAIDGFSEALLSDYGPALDARAREYLGRVRAGTRRMFALIEDLLALSRISHAPMGKEPVDLSSIARVIVAELRRRDPARLVSVEIADGLTAHGDPRLVTILLENLLGNAWKFTSKQPRASIVFGRDGGGVFFARDNGAGFDQAHARKLFVAFQRLHDASEFEGSGIGLATALRIVDRHGGRIWAEGRPGQGATFHFTLPA